MASYGFAQAYKDYRKAHPIPLGSGTLIGRTIAEGGPVHIPDTVSDPLFAEQEARKVGGFRTMLGVPLLREGTPIGVLAVTRAVPRELASKRIELLRQFRRPGRDGRQGGAHDYLNDFKEALEQQTATSELLRIISTSPTDLKKVLDTVAKKPLYQLCVRRCAHLAA